MPEVTLPFNEEMRRAIREGKKVCTSRSEKKGEIGDWFTLDGRIFRIVDIQFRMLGWIRDTMYRLEGFDSPEAFETLWRKIHRGHFTEGKVYTVHYFAAVSPVIIEGDGE
jgi:hypothetical protein